MVGDANPPKICVKCGREYNKRSINSEKYCNCENTNEQVLIVEITDEENGTVYQEYQE